ncbi:Phage integrase family protein [Pricia antarctica]|uniref:Phage integrase family protein n=1 Tax=Pricia antarctica TaxID=641691 RepID=A0A1G7DIH6_9FLAO|nr:tyrosine-type recombinase/integrase [Pricia antarctica]SDE51299.1 Phage integrase family protein [Pricia antarctica]
MEEVAKVKETLRQKKYDYYRFIEIFFHSGCRTMELLGVQKKGLNLKARVFKITVLKGDVYSEEMRALSNNALIFWIEIMEMAKAKTDYLFSSRLVPGAERMDRDQISRLWKRHIKDKLGITADFYSLKHLHTTMIINEHGKELAANINGHKSSKMNDEHYDLLAKKRLLKVAKNSDVGF